MVFRPLVPNQNELYHTPLLPKIWYLSKRFLWGESGSKLNKLASLDKPSPPLWKKWWKKLKKLCKSWTKLEKSKNLLLKSYMTQLGLVKSLKTFILPSLTRDQANLWRHVYINAKCFRRTFTLHYNIYKYNWYTDLSRTSWKVPMANNDCNSFRKYMTSRSPQTLGPENLTQWKSESVINGRTELPTHRDRC